jgi:hypothetical protein
MKLKVKGPAPKPVQRQFILTLSEEEAKTLWAVTRRIGGSGPVRDVTDNIGALLADAFDSEVGVLGVKYGGLATNAYLEDIGKHIEIGMKVKS